MNETPKRKIATIYGIMNDPPPLAYRTLGKRQILPKPTAEPTIARIKPQRLFHCALSSAIISHIKDIINN